jgi:hypothetical protein
MPETEKVYLSKIPKGLAIKLMLNHELNRIVIANDGKDIGDNMEHLEEKDIKHLARYFEELNDNKSDALRSMCVTAYKDKLEHSVKPAAAAKTSLADVHSVSQSTIITQYSKRGLKIMGKLLSTAALMIADPKIDLMNAWKSSAPNDQNSQRLLLGMTWQHNKTILEGDESELNNKIHDVAMSTEKALSHFIANTIVSNTRVDPAILNYQGTVSDDEHEIAFVYAVNHQILRGSKHMIVKDAEGKYNAYLATDVPVNPAGVAPTQEGTAPELAKTKSEVRRETHADPTAGLPQEAGTAPELAKFEKDDSGIFMKSDGVEGDTAENSQTEVAVKGYKMTEAKNLEKSATEIIDPEAKPAKTVRGPRFAQPHTLKIPKKTNDFSGSTVLGLTKHSAFKFNNSQNNFRSLYV